MEVGLPAKTSTGSDGTSAGRPGTLSHELSPFVALPPGEIPSPISSARPEWQRDAACRGRGPEEWFHERAKFTQQHLCDACPVMVDCLAYSLGEGPSLHGVWAGYSKRQRAKLRGSARRLKLGVIVSGGRNREGRPC